MPVPTDFDAWFTLLQAPGLSREATRRLLTAFGSAEAVLAARPAAWGEIAGAKALAAAQALTRPPAEMATRHAAALAWLQGGEDRHLITLGDAAYPAALLQTADPPLALWVEGDLAWLQRPALAIVGSRHASAQGLDHARDFAASLGRAGWVIVSGLASGIDAAAHVGALDAGGASLAVIGCGPDIAYPRNHAALMRRLVGQGAVMSEHAPGTPPLAAHFPQRNRVIAGLARGTLVVEAAVRSGSLITARLAAEAGREVFAIPGSIHAPQSRGCHALIKQGAKLVESVDDVLEELGASAHDAASPSSPAASPPATPGVAAARVAGDPDDWLLDALGHDPVNLDMLLARTGRDGSEVLARLLELELDRRVARLPGGLYQRRGLA